MLGVKPAILVTCRRSLCHSHGWRLNCRTQAGIAIGQQCCADQRASPYDALRSQLHRRPQDEFVSFDDTPHVLVVGMTGAGKSVLMQTMLLSLAAATSPAECKFVLVDLKNEDLVPFENLPHTLTFAGIAGDALDALRFVYDEKEKRIAQRGYKPYRLVTIIDEMAQLAGDSEA